MNQICTVEQLTDLCRKYITDPSCVYTLSDDRYIVVMKKLHDTITNEARANIVDASHALFRADKLKVLHIVDLYDIKNRVRSIQDRSVADTAQYTVNVVVLPRYKFDANINGVRTGGLFYNNTIETAYHSILPCPNGYTGSRTVWYDNGQMMYVGMFVDGKKSGQWTFWYDNGQMKTQGGYVEGKRLGQWPRWREDGSKFSVGEFIDGVLQGRWLVWHSDGRECVCVCGDDSYYCSCGCHDDNNDIHYDMSIIEEFD